MTEEFEEVVPEFRKLAEENPHDVTVLKGLAEACLQTAKDMHCKRLLGCARDFLQEALDAVSRFVSLFFLFAQRSSLT